MVPRSVLAVAGALTAVVLSVLPPQAAHAAPPGAGAGAGAGTGTPAVGYDVSWPQCGKRLPSTAAFAIIGLNGGLANDWNACFLDQLEWAQQATAGADGFVDVYVNTANANEGASWRPDNDWTRDRAAYVDPAANPYGTCVAQPRYSEACTFVYGYSFAVQDVSALQSYGLRAEDFRWWLDVETMNTWDGSAGENTAALEGMTAYFTSLGLEVGLYSTGYQWSVIAGTTPEASNLYSLPSWLAGSSSSTDARADCRLPPLTGGGSVAMTQYIAKRLDHNVACG